MLNLCLLEEIFNSTLIEGQNAERMDHESKMHSKHTNDEDHAANERDSDPFHSFLTPLDLLSFNLSYLLIYCLGGASEQPCGRLYHLTLAY